MEHICFRTTSGSNMGGQTCFWPREPPDVVMPLMVYQDRLETNLLQLFVHPENSEWFSIHLKALVFLYAFKESVDCHLLSSFCDDSNLHISLFKYVLSTMGVSKDFTISRKITHPRFHVKLRILSPENCKQRLQVKSWKAEVTAEKKQSKTHSGGKAIHKWEFSPPANDIQVNPVWRSY